MKNVLKFVWFFGGLFSGIVWLYNQMSICHPCGKSVSHFDDGEEGILEAW
jgi:hypothetical protein